jgi:hypothetical protein
MRAVLAALMIVFSPAASAQAQVLEAGPLRLSFIAASGGVVPDQTVQIRQLGQTPVQWQARASAPWIRVEPVTGTGDAALRIGVDTGVLSPGSHDGQVTVIGPPGLAPIVVTVRLEIRARAASGAPVGEPPAESTGTVTLSSPLGAQDPATAVLNLPAESGAPTRWRVKPDQPWLSVRPPSGALPARLTVAATPTKLPPGEHQATLVFTDAGGDVWKRIPVVFAIGDGGGAALSLATDVLPPATRNLPYSQAIPIKGGRPPYTIRIIQGRLPRGLTLNGTAISGATREAGTFPLALEVTDGSTPPATITKPLLLQVIVLMQDTALVVSPPAISLVLTPNQRTQGARLAIGSGRQSLLWTAATDVSWLRLSPGRGSSPSMLQMEVEAASLEPGTYTATVTITMDGAPNSPARVPVQVVVKR